MTTDTESRFAGIASSAVERESVSVVVPIEDDAAGLEELVRDVASLLERHGWTYEILLMDNGSPHRALLERLAAEHEAVDVVPFHQRFEESVVLSAGFERATGEYLVTLPHYRQVEVEDLVQLLDTLESGYDFVAGWRYPRVDPMLNRLQSSVFNLLARRFTRAEFHDLNCRIRAMRRRVVEQIDIYAEMFRFLPILAERQGFKIAEVKLRHREEVGKVGFFGVGAYVRRILDLTTMFFLIKFTKKPLRFFGLVGFALMFIGVAICLYLSIEKLMGQGPGLSGRPALVLGVLMIVLGMQTISIGLIGEMIIFTHAKSMKEYQVDRVLDGHS